jgi:hypothetical protein
VQELVRRFVSRRRAAAVISLLQRTDSQAPVTGCRGRSLQPEGNFFGSIAPSLWAQGLEINSILYEDYGVKMFSNVVACKRATIEKKPDLCEAFVSGLMDGLKYVYLNPEKSVTLHLESVKEFQGGSVANQKVIEYGQAVSTALGVVPDSMASVTWIPSSSPRRRRRSRPIWAPRTYPRRRPCSPTSL